MYNNDVCVYYCRTYYKAVRGGGNDVGKESAQKFMKQTDALKAATLDFASS